MRGSVRWQVDQVFNSVKALGTSKHDDKSEARAAGAQLWADLQLNVHGAKTLEQYKTVSAACFQHAKTEYGLRDLTKMDENHVQGYMLKVIETGGNDGGMCSRSTANVYHSALAKLELALTVHAEQKGLSTSYDFKVSGTKENQKVGTRALASKTLGTTNKASRAHARPADLVKNIPGKHNLLGRALLESGARISELSTIRPQSMQGLKVDTHTGKLCGYIAIRVKGGSMNSARVSAQTYKEIEGKIAENGGKAISWSQANFRDHMKQSASKTGQPYHGPHGLRWNAAQSRMDTLQRHGLSYEAALSVTSQEMGHHRSTITEHYQR